MQLINKLLSLILLALVVATGYNFYAKGRPIPFTEIVADILQEPFQEEQMRFPIEFTYEENSYIAEPIADFEIWGLIVADDSWKFPVDLNKISGAMPLKNLCIIWGDNADGNLHEHLRFRLRPWACSAAGERLGELDKSALLNLHLIASKPAVQEEVKALHKGDQIRLKGYLADYSNVTGRWSERTGLYYDSEANQNTRILLVNEMEVLKPGNQQSHLLYDSGKKLLLIVLAAKLLFVLMMANHEVRRMDTDYPNH